MATAKKYRNNRLLASANGETCVVCGSEQGVVWAHCNELAAGKGMGTKSHDLIGAYLCQACHTIYDEGQSTRQEKQAFFLRAFFKSMVKVAEKSANGELRL